MKLRLPTLADIAGLFFAKTTVDAAVADLRAAGDRVRAVIEHNRAKAEYAEQRRRDLQEAATLEADIRDQHYEEANRAARVSSKLTELLA